MGNNKIIPRLYCKTKGEITTQVTLSLSASEHKSIIRLTGGCGKMSSEDGENLINTFVDAFAGYRGSLLFGGTRMIDKMDDSIVMGITEVAPAIKKKNPHVCLGGVIPKSDMLQISDKGLIVSNNDNEPYFTICHPNQDLVLLVQLRVDPPHKREMALIDSQLASSIWDLEVYECFQMVNDLHENVNYKPLLISYNGGNVTRKEIMIWSKSSLPVLLIKGSGRVTDETYTG